MDDPHLGHSVPESFDRLQTDIERVEYILNCHSFIRDFELRSKYGIKSFEKTVQFREVMKDHFLSILKQGRRLIEWTLY